MTARHSTDELTRVRFNADRLFAHLTDYQHGIEPSLLYKTIYLTEFARAFDLDPAASADLNDMREAIATACGIVQCVTK